MSLRIAGGEGAVRKLHALTCVRFHDAKMLSNDSMGEITGIPWSVKKYYLVTIILVRRLHLVILGNIAYLSFNGGDHIKP